MRSITVFMGDGIGPEITDAVLKILDAAAVYVLQCYCTTITRQNFSTCNTGLRLFSSP